MKTILLSILTLFISYSVQAQQPTPMHSHPDHLEVLITEYLNMKNSLVSDDFESAKNHLMAFSKEVKNSTEMNQHEEHAEMHDAHHRSMMSAVTQAENADDIQSFRVAFVDISQQLLTALENQGYEGTLFKQFCPMYEGGSAWISDKDKIENPYYGSIMHSCGETVSEI